MSDMDSTHKRSWLKQFFGGDWFLRLFLPAFAASLILIPVGVWFGRAKPPSGHLDLGKAYLRNGDYDKAIASLTLAQNDDPANPEIYYSRALAYLRISDSNDAISDFSTSIILTHGDADTYAKRGGAYVGQEQYEEAISDFTKSISLQPKLSFFHRHQCLRRAIYYYCRAFAYMKNEQYPEAISDINSSIVLFPRFSGFYELRGLIAFFYYNPHQSVDQISSLNEVRKDFTTAIALNPRNAVNYALRSFIDLAFCDGDTLAHDLKAFKRLAPPDVLQRVPGFVETGLPLSKSLTTLPSARPIPPLEIRPIPPYPLAFTNGIIVIASSSFLVIVIASIILIIIFWRRRRPRSVLRLLLLLVLVPFLEWLLMEVILVAIIIPRLP